MDAESGEGDTIALDVTELGMKTQFIQSLSSQNLSYVFVQHLHIHL